MYIGNTYIDVELPKGYSIVPHIDSKTPISLTRYNYLVYHYAVLIGLVYADKDPTTYEYVYTLTKWDRNIIITSRNIHELLTNYCTQHKMGLLK